MRTDRIVKRLMRTKFLVTTKDGQTWEGVLMDADPSTFLLVEAALVAGDGTRTAADGQILISRSDVAYMQRT